eukprot:391980_1
MRFNERTDNTHMIIRKPSAEGLLERDESRRVCGSNARATVTDWLVGDGEFAQVMADHIRLDFDQYVSHSVVHANLTGDHLRHNDRIPEVRLDDGRLLVLAGGLLGLSDALHQFEGVGLQAAVEFSADTSSEELHKLSALQVQQVVDLDSTKVILSECAASCWLIFLLNGHGERLNDL